MKKTLLFGIVALMATFAAEAGVCAVWTNKSKPTAKAVVGTVVACKNWGIDQGVNVLGTKALTFHANKRINDSVSYSKSAVVENYTLD